MYTDIHINLSIHRSVKQKFVLQWKSSSRLSCYWILFFNHPSWSRSIDNISAKESLRSISLATFHPNVSVTVRILWIGFCERDWVCEDFRRPRGESVDFFQLWDIVFTSCISIFFLLSMNTKDNSSSYSCAEDSECRFPWGPTRSHINSNLEDLGYVQIPAYISQTKQTVSTGSPSSGSHPLTKKSLTSIVVWTTVIREAVFEEVEARATQAAVQPAVVQHDCNERVDVSKVCSVGHLHWADIVRQKPKWRLIKLRSSVSGTAAVHMISCLKVVCAVPFSCIEDPNAARRESLVGSTTSARWSSATVGLTMMSGSFLNMFSRARPSSVILVLWIKEMGDPRILAKRRRLFRLVPSAHGLRVVTPHHFPRSTRVPPVSSKN